VVAFKRFHECVSWQSHEHGKAFKLASLCA
jgi:hypothetical protein